MQRILAELLFTHSDLTIIIWRTNNADPISSFIVRHCRIIVHKNYKLSLICTIHPAGARLVVWDAMINWNKLYIRLVKIIPRNALPCKLLIIRASNDLSATEAAFWTIVQSKSAPWIVNFLGMTNVFPNQSPTEPFCSYLEQFPRLISLAATNLCPLRSYLQAPFISLFARITARVSRVKETAL